MKDKEKIFIIKLGGSCFSDKTVPKSLHLDTIDILCKQLEELGIKAIIVHGGGSFGHPVAKKYAIQNGFDPSIKDQAMGFALTHHAMVELNYQIINRMLDNGIPAYPLQTSAIFIQDSNKVSSAYHEPVIKLLEKGFYPVLYGDSVLDLKRQFGIMSGDSIIVDLVNSLDVSIGAIIYLMDVDGLYTSNPKEKDEARLISHVILRNNTFYVESDGAEVKLEDFISASDSSIDVTGGIINKFHELKRVHKKDTIVYLINGRKQGTIIDVIEKGKQNCTKIVINPTEAME